MEFAGGKTDVVDPEVRAYVASLVTAVSDQLRGAQDASNVDKTSWEEAVQTKMDDTYWETTHWHVSAISKNGSSSTTKRRIDWTWHDAWRSQIWLGGIFYKSWHRGQRMSQTTGSNPRQHYHVWN